MLIPSTGIIFEVRNLNLFIPRPNTEALKKRFRYRGAVTWNSLSAEAKQATTLRWNGTLKGTKKLV